MRAAIANKFGPPEVLEIKDVPMPELKENEVLVKIKAATVTAGDCEMRRYDLPWWIWLPGKFFIGFRKPKNPVLGQEFAGTIEQVGSAVTELEPGDEIYAPTDLKLGSYAEYKSISTELAFSLKPSQLSFAEAAAIPVGGVNALHFVRKAKIVKGDHVLINGSGGSIGTYALQLCKNLGAVVTAVDSLDKLQMLERLGADHVIDYKTQDFRRNRNSYDVILDIVEKGFFTGALKSLKRGGKYVMLNPEPFALILGKILTLFKGRKVISGLADYTPVLLDEAGRLASEGLVQIVIDREYRLEDIVEAHKYVEAGKKAGNLVIRP